MYKIFNVDPTHVVGLTHPARWNFIKDRLTINLDKVVQFYRNTPYTVKSSHLLVRLLHSIAVPQSQEVTRYYDNVDSIALRVAMALGLTSTIYAGSVHEGVFYGPGNSEIIIAHNESFDPEWATRNWETLCPIVVLRHPRSDMGLNLADGTKTGVEEGIVVVSINITLLAIQYRAFRQQEMRLTAISGQSQRSMMQFLHMYPITNMLPSQLDISLFNRLDCLEADRPLGVQLPSHKHSFHMMKLDDEINDYNVKLIEVLRNSRGSFYSTLKNIPLITSNSLFEMTATPDVAPTRQVTWALAIAELPVIEFLFRTAEQSAIRRNASEVNMMIRSIRAYRRSSIFKEKLPYSLYLDIEASFDRILTSIQER